ncbi:hypothetical protein BHM03_00037609 [Ensete ventricosum]|nr:hypothetical protein BHM03_00037609 [Ensete ventricosum]
MYLGQSNQTLLELYTSASIISPHPSHVPWPYLEQFSDGLTLDAPIRASQATTQALEKIWTHGSQRSGLPLGLAQHLGKTPFAGGGEENDRANNGLAKLTETHAKSAVHDSIEIPRQPD